MARKVEALTEIPVTYGNVSIEDETARVSAHASRSNLKVPSAVKNLVSKRLSGRLIALPNGDAPGQTILPGAEPAECSGVFDIKGISITDKKIGFGMTFKLSDIDLGLFAGLAKRDGRILIDTVEDLDEEEEDQETED